MRCAQGISAVKHPHQRSEPVAERVGDRKFVDGPQGPQQKQSVRVRRAGEHREATKSRRDRLVDLGGELREILDRQRRSTRPQIRNAALGEIARVKHVGPAFAQGREAVGQRRLDEVLSACAGFGRRGGRLCRNPRYRTDPRSRRRRDGRQATARRVRQSSRSTPPTKERPPSRAELRSRATLPSLGPRPAQSPGRHPERVAICRGGRADRRHRCPHPPIRTR